MRCNDEEVEVCKKTFCDIHAVGKQRVEVLCEKLKAGQLMLVVHTKIVVQFQNKLKNGLGNTSNHFCDDRATILVGIIGNASIGLIIRTVALMYRLFLSRCDTEAFPDEPIYVVKEWLYCKIFNEEFNLSFGYPRSDTCQICDELRIAVASASAEAQDNELNSQLVEHQLKASQAYQLLQSDTKLSENDPELHVITFDLQQNLPVPTLTHSSLHQLWVYNQFGNHVCNCGSAVMCMWNECVAG